MIASQVVRTLFGFHLREGMGSSYPPDYHNHYVSIIQKSVIIHKEKTIEINV